MKEATGVGVDGLRGRHIIYLSEAAKAALAKLLTALEKRRRWPDILRTVIEIARGKKLGGARLIGISPTLYRLWAKIRYSDIRQTIEERVKRPFLAAAPGRGAAQAVFELAWNDEMAMTMGEMVATTLSDFEKYYESISIAEVAEGARRVGIPLTIVAMACHLYLGPRHISVNQAVSQAIFPRRSILAGCTWATLLIRAIMIKPVERFMEALKTGHGVGR